MVREAYNRGDDLMEIRTAIVTLKSGSTFEIKASGVKPLGSLPDDAAVALLDAYTTAIRDALKECFTKLMQESAEVTIGFGRD